MSPSEVISSPVYFLSTAKLGPVNTRLHHAGIPSIGGSPMMTIIIAALVLAIVAVIASAARRSARS